MISFISGALQKGFDHRRLLRIGAVSHDCIAGHIVLSVLGLVPSAPWHFDELEMYFIHTDF